jgi:hypothetical protein
MTDITSSTSIPAIIIFGTDEKGRPHASYFEQTDLTAAEKAASVMGMRSLITSSEEERALATELPRGRLFVSGRAFVPFVGARLHRRLTAAVKANNFITTTNACNNNSPDLPDNLCGAQPDATTDAEPVGAFEPPGAVSVPPAAETEPAAGLRPDNRPLPPEPTLKRPRRGQNTLESAQIAPAGATPADPGQATAQPDPDAPQGYPAASQSDRQGGGQGRQRPNWGAIKIGSVVLGTTGINDGWWLAVVTEVDDDILVLRWRDWPDEPAFSRRRAELALLHPGRAAQEQQANLSA